MLGRHDPPLSVECRWEDRRATVVVRGEVDFATAGILAQQLDEVAGQQPEHLTVDLGQTSFLDAAGLRVIAHVTAEGQPMPGVTAAIALFERCGLRLAIASSSPLRLIDAVCDRLGLTRIEVRCSAMDEARGKPAPDVYLAAARRLGVAAASCLALEDSPAGIASARSAGMRCVAVPDPLLADDPRYREADLVLESLTRLDEAALRRLGVPVPG